MQECWQNIQTCRHKYVVMAAREEPGEEPKEPNGRRCSGRAEPLHFCLHVNTLVFIFTPHGLGSNWNSRKKLLGNRFEVKQNQLILRQKFAAGTEADLKPFLALTSFNIHQAQIWKH